MRITLNFRLFIERINIHNVICLNECWLENTHNMSDFDLPNYTLYHTTEKCCRHGGLMIYVHNQFNAKSLLIKQINTMYCTIAQEEQQEELYYLQCL